MFEKINQRSIPMKSEVKRRVRICVLGPRQVGKTTLVFRYMARLFAGARASHSHSTGTDNLYHHCVCLDNVLYDLEILDSAQSKDGTKVSPQIDAFIVVYSVASRADFDEATQISENLRALYPRKPLLLVGNKTDLPRAVSSAEGQKVGGALFAEVSAAHIGSWEVHQAMYQLLRCVSQLATDTPAVSNGNCHFIAKTDRFGRVESMDTSTA